MTSKMIYRVRRAFAHEGAWYTRRNESEVADLPKDFRDGLLESGSIEEVTAADVINEEGPSAAPLDFASDEAAETFMALDESERGLVARALAERKPSGAGGYTVEDVRKAAK